MSWSVSKSGRGAELAALVEGLFHREAELGHHNEYSRATLESHLVLARLFTTRHHNDMISFVSYGHFNSGVAATEGTGQTGFQAQILEHNPSAAQPTEEQPPVNTTDSATAGTGDGVEVLTVEAGPLPVTEPTGSEGPES